MATAAAEAIPNAVWSPLRGSQHLFAICPFDEVLYEGTRGPGKTDSLLMSFARWCGLGFGQHWRGIIFRQQSTQLVDVISKSKRWFKQFFPKARFIGGGGYKWIFPDGEELLMRHMRRPDDYWAYHGHEYPWIGWEELTNWHTLECYDAMQSCNRSSYGGFEITDKMQARRLHREVGEHVDMPRWIRSTCNPFGVGHGAVKARFIDPAPRMHPIRETFENPVTGEKITRTRIAIHGTLWENKFLIQNDPQYVANLLAIKDKNRRRAWVFGDWGISSGGIFDGHWDANVHVLPDFAVPEYWEITRAFDWGSSKPFSVGWYTRPTEGPFTFPSGRVVHFRKGDVIRIGEWYGWNGEANKGLGLPNRAIGAGIKQHELEKFPKHRVRAGRADSSIYDEKTGRAMTIGKEMAEEGASFEPADKGPNSRVNGWQLIVSMLDESKRQGREAPGFWVTESCKHFIRTVPSLPRDLRPGHTDDVDTESEDHVGDEVRYELYRSGASIVVRRVRGR